MGQNANAGKLSQLWKIGFGESDEALEYLFEYLYDDKHTLNHEVDGKICASLQYLLSSVNLFGKNIDASYIFGVVTHPDFRKRGYVSNLTKRLFRRHFEDGVAIATLIPQESYLFNIYEKYGFHAGFSCNSSEFIKRKCEQGLYEFSEINSCENMTNLYEFYDKSYCNFPISFRKNFAQFSFFLQCFSKFEGRIFLVKKNNRIAGISFVSNFGGTPFVKEILSEDIDVERSMLNSVIKELNIGKIHVMASKFLHENPLKKIVGMGRIINVRAVIAALDVTNGTSFQIKDDIIPENNGKFVVENGKTTEVENLECMYKFDIKMMAEYVFNSKFAYMNIMLN